MERRKDSKGRVLNNGESQRSDGRYSYQYTDIDGSRKVVYSWKLTAGDKTPAGKRKDLSLREKEKQINDTLSKGVATNGGNMTVLELVERYVSQKKGVKTGTKGNYQYFINSIKNENLADKRIDKIKYSDAKKWALKLHNDGKSFYTINCIKSFIKGAYKTAIEDDLILKNPFDFKLSSVIKNDSEKKTSLTKQQKDQFLDFIKNDNCYKKYYNAIYILFETGLRISELCGLTMDDVDLEERTINVRRQVIVDGKKINGERKRFIETLKSSAGMRIIPFDEDVAERFKDEIRSRNKIKIEPIVDGIHGFIFLDKKGMPTYANLWDWRFSRIMRKFNRLNNIPFPKVTPHICRHTFCSDRMNDGMNVKILQYIMGHSDASLTMNVYSHIHIEDVIEQYRITKNGKNAV